MLNKKLYAFIAIDLIIIALLLGYFGLYRNKEAIQIHGVYMPNALAFNECKLEDTDHRLLTTKQLLGHWSILYFGFTNCPSICPTTLSQVNTFYNQLPAAIRPEVIFVSVDPTKDTLDKIKSYVHRFNSDFIGARADINEVLRLEQSLHLNINPENPLNHSMELVLINPQGSIQAYFSYPQIAQYLKEDYLSILKHHSREGRYK